MSLNFLFLPWPHCRHGDGEEGGGGGQGCAACPDDEDGQHHACAARLGGQGPHYRLPPVHRDGQQREHGARDAQVGDEVVEGAVYRAEDPISARKTGAIGCCCYWDKFYCIKGKNWHAVHRSKSLNEVLKSDLEVRINPHSVVTLCCAHITCFLELMRPICDPFN